MTRCSRHRAIAKQWASPRERLFQTSGNLVPLLVWVYKDSTFFYFGGSVWDLGVSTRLLGLVSVSTIVLRLNAQVNACQIQHTPAGEEEEDECPHEVFYSSMVLFRIWPCFVCERTCCLVCGCYALGLSFKNIVCRCVRGVFQSWFCRALRRWHKSNEEGTSSESHDPPKRSIFGLSSHSCMSFRIIRIFLHVPGMFSNVYFWVVHILLFIELP